MAKEKLQAYQAKRDFSLTREPSGDHPAKLAERLRFVVQKHDATRLHYNMRLELDGVFKSWAVTRGPSLDPHEKRLAVEVEDHPLGYGDFEGTIPMGQYGGGTVQLWDRGTWAPQGMTAEQGLASGDLKFTLDGMHLHGSWVLVRIKNWSGGKRTNWLLIKHRDDHAHARAHDGDTDSLLARDSSIASGRSMAEIEAGTGRAPELFMTQGGAAPVAKDTVWDSNKGLAPTLRGRGRTAAEEIDMPDFVEPQLCRSFERPPIDAGWVHEIKFDGYRIQARVAAGATRLRTRKGLDWTDRFSAIADACTSLAPCIVDGEIVALDKNGAPDFAGLQAALSEGRTDQLVFFVFDVLFADGEDLRTDPLSVRKDRLRALTAKLGKKTTAGVRFVDHFEAPGEAVLRSACRLSLEGIVSKRLDAAYTFGRSDGWTKAKCHAGREVVIGAWTTTGAAFRSLIVGVHRGEHFIHVGRVGTGYGGDKARDLLRRLEPLREDRSPFTGPGAPRKAAEPPAATGCTW